MLCETLQTIEQQKSAELTPRTLASNFRFTSTTPETLQRLDLPTELSSLSRHLQDRENRLCRCFTRSSSENESDSSLRVPNKRNSTLEMPTPPKKAAKPTSSSPCQSKRTTPAKVTAPSRKKPVKLASAILTEDLTFTDSDEDLEKLSTAVEQILQDQQAPVQYRRPVLPERTDRHGREHVVAGRATQLIPLPKKSHRWNIFVFIKHSY